MKVFYAAIMTIYTTSPSVRRAWIEIAFGGSPRDIERSPSVRRAWIEIASDKAR